MADPTDADHICVLVHGLWGSPSHLDNVAKALRERHPADRLHVLVAKRNRANYTYDGIEVGGERLAQEVEDELAELEARGNRITKISVVGYSLGGLIARYCVGLFFSRGLFERIQPVNFTAFASPFVGVRTPDRGYRGAIYNALASQVLSASGRQLFLVDSFRDSRRPLLDIMTDSNSIFMAGLRRFKNLAVYANIVNDLTTPWFTASFTRTDPSVNLDAVKLKYMKGHESVLLDPECPVAPKETEDVGTLTRAYNSSISFVNNLPWYGLLAVTIPISITFLVVNSGLQAIYSNQRVLLHNADKAGSFKAYRTPYLMGSTPDSLATVQPRPSIAKDSELSNPAEASDCEEHNPVDRNDCLHVASEKDFAAERTLATTVFPLLTLDPLQERMIDALDSLGVRKYPVYISKTRQAHAAIIARKNWQSMEEGYVVLQHWLDHEFRI